MNMKILELYTCASNKKVGWEYEGKNIQLSFERSIKSYLVAHRNEIVVLGNTDEFGPQNLRVITESGVWGN